MDGLREREDHQELSIGIDGNLNIDKLGDDISRLKFDTEKDRSRGVLEREEQLGEKDMAPMTGNSIHRSSSRPQLDLSGAAIQGNFEEKDPTILLPNQSDDISHLALDIGGNSLCGKWFFGVEFCSLWCRLCELCAILCV